MRTEPRPRPRSVRVVRPRGHAQPLWAACLVGVGLAAVSAACLALFAWVARVARAFPGGPRFPAAAGGGLDPFLLRLLMLLLGAGAVLVVWGIVQGARALLEARRRSRAPDPWRADHPWSRAGATDESPREGTDAIGWGLTTLALDVALAAAVLPEVGSGARRAVLGFAALAGAGAVVAVAWGALRLARRARHGRLELRFTRFPFFLGGSLDVELVRRPGAPPLGPVEATLRCVQEVRHVERIADDAQWTIDRTEVWSCTRGLEGVPPRATRVPIRLDLPRSPGLSTELSANPPRYWELELTSRMPGLELGATFLVPVYAAPLETSPPPRGRDAPGDLRSPLDRGRGGL